MSGSDATVVGTIGEDGLTAVASSSPSDEPSVSHDEVMAVDQGIERQVVAEISDGDNHGLWALADAAEMEAEKEVAEEEDGSAAVDA